MKEGRKMLAAAREITTITVLQGLADDVNRAAGRTVASIIETGRRLLAAKEAAGHGQWEKLFDADALERPIVFSLRGAVRLMAIAKCEALTKSANLAVFPPHIATLEEIAKLPDDIFRAALKDGLIHPEMETADVGKLHVVAGKLAEVRGPAPREPRPRPAVPALAMGEPRFVTYDVLDAASTKPTTVIIEQLGAMGRQGGAGPPYGGDQVGV